MKIWIDLANSPQVLFFRPIIRELERRGHVVEITTRAYAQTVALADQYGFQHTIIGRHGGRDLLELVRQNGLRGLELARWARGRGFALAVSHNSYSQVVAATLLRLPAITLMDYEHQPLNHLCFRLARRVIVPEAFPEASLRQSGAWRKAARYPGVKEQVYLADFMPQPDYRDREGLPTDTPLIVIRPPAPWTAYHRFENNLFDQLLEHLAADNHRYLLFLPRIPSQADSVRTLPGIHVAPKVYDGPNLLYHADLVISGGGTMNREAAVLGTTVYTVFKGKLGAVDRYLIERHRMIQVSEAKDIPMIQVARRNGAERSTADPCIVQDITDLILN